MTSFPQTFEEQICSHLCLVMLGFWEAGIVREVLKQAGKWNISNEVLKVSVNTANS